VPVPGNLTFAPVDFENESLRDGLERAGLDFRDPTFFSCLGVLMYLTEGALDELLAFLGSFPEGSEVVLTFSPDLQTRIYMRDRSDGLLPPRRTTLARAWI
jgi:O-methyltransferase involved in polyketide biosynthesis